VRPESLLLPVTAVRRDVAAVVSAARRFRARARSLDAHAVRVTEALAAPARRAYLAHSDALSVGAAVRPQFGAAWRPRRPHAGLAHVARDEMRARFVDRAAGGGSRRDERASVVRSG
jgi:hypothetical protein